MPLKKENFTLDDLNTDKEFRKAFWKFYDSKNKGRISGCTGFLDEMIKFENLWSDYTKNPNDNIKRKSALDQFESIGRSLEQGSLELPGESAENLNQMVANTPILPLIKGSRNIDEDNEIIKPYRKLKNDLMKTFTDQGDIETFNEIQRKPESGYLYPEASVDAAKQFFEKRNPPSLLNLLSSQASKQTLSSEDIPLPPTRKDILLPTTRTRHMGHDDTAFMPEYMKRRHQILEQEKSERNEKLKEATAAETKRNLEKTKPGNDLIDLNSFVNKAGKELDAERKIRLEALRASKTTDTDILPNLTKVKNALNSLKAPIASGNSSELYDTLPVVLTEINKAKEKFDEIKNDPAYGSMRDIAGKYSKMVEKLSDDLTQKIKEIPKPPSRNRR